MPIIEDPRFTGRAIAGSIVGERLDAPEVDREQPLLDVLAAAARQSTIAGAAYERFTNRDPDGPDAPPGFDALDHIAGFEFDAHRFVEAETPAEVEGIKRRLNAERADRVTLARAGLGGPAAEIGLNLLDPSFLAAAAVPELAFAKAGRLASSVNAAIKGGAGASAYEFGMQNLQEDRTALESIVNIGGGALLSGVLGSLTRYVPEPERLALNEAIRSEVGAATVRRPTTLAAESFATGGQTLAKVAGKVPFAETDLGVVMHSQSTAARVTLQELADVVPILEKNVAGIATPTSVEAFVLRHEGRVADFADYLKRAWVKYRNHTPAAERLTRSDFEASVAGAARRGDADLVPEIAEGAKYLRARVFDPLKVEAQKLGLLPKDIELIGAESYFRRMYNREAIRNARGEWDAILSRHFMRQGGSAVEAKAAADDVTRKILGADVGQANFATTVSVPTAGPLLNRVLDIPDELIERFLVSDPLRVAQSYVREMAPQIEVTKRFGDKDMLAAFDAIRDEYGILRERARAALGTANPAKALTKLQDEEQRVLNALARVRDRVYGRAGRLGPESSAKERKAVEVLRGWRNIVGSAKLGGAALTSGAMDLARIVGEFGFLPTFSRLVKFASSPTVRKLSKAKARRLGAAVEVALARRVLIASDGAVTEGWTHGLANGVYRWSGLNHLTDFQRTLAASLFEDEALKVAAELAAGKALRPFARTRLAALGLDEDALRRVAEQAKRYGGSMDGVRVSGSSHWDDAELAAVYDAAILKESRILVFEPGAADRPWWMDREAGRVIGQLKAFTLAAPLRLTITPFQMIGQGQYLAAARLVGALLVGGYLTHVFRQLAAGREPTTDPRQAAAEAFYESGVGGILPDLLSPLGRRFGLWGESARYSDRNVLTAYGGPSVGTFGDLYDLAFNRTANGMNARDLHLLRRLLPYQNLWYLRRAINALEGEAAEAMDLQGAELTNFGERVTRTVPMLPTAERGPTGTGALQY